MYRIARAGGSLQLWSGAAERSGAERGGGAAGRRGGALAVTLTVTTAEGVGGLWTGGGAPPPAIPRSIALKFFRKSSPICPNTPSCQPFPKKYLNRGLTYPTRFVYTEPVNKSSVALTASFTGTAERTANAPHLVRHAEWPLPDTASGLFDSVI